MKELLNLGGGAVVLSEQAGDFVLSINEKAALGGGSASGVVSVQGSASVVLKGKLAFDLGMQILEAHSPAAIVPLEQGIEAIADGAILGQ